MKLHLQRPLAFFDLETTGTDVGRDRIVELAIIRIMPDGTESSIPEITEPPGRQLINPGIPIPAEASMVHGIYDSDVSAAPTFADLAPKLLAFLDGCDLGGFNSNRFDIPLLAEEFLRAGMDFSIENRNLIDVQVIFHLMEPRNLSAGYRFYCGHELLNAHGALPDVLATKDIFSAMLDHYADTKIQDNAGNWYKPVVNDMAKIHELSERRKRADLAGHLVYNEQGQAVFNFGKYKSIPVAEVLQKDPGYFGWLMNAEFPLYTKKVVKAIRDSIRPAG